ncbi:MAG: UDP-N-acetylmuramoyl-L-alanyl-D-glutamate--2,6-diaminopimelate ligase [Dethiobacter sp.]|jgi:UDP-N-acetylmuramyl-tripeptide synthetase|nr:MAG: UDP-N-acetylmuramoyl-L-alanyl-D-glutamate--2,6-diaminopimelate ligase [Dethiobacter sp.]
MLSLPEKKGKIVEIVKELSELLKFIHVIKVEGQIHIPVRGLAYHSGRVQPGYIFFCLKGSKVDGHEFIPQAVDAGAVAVVLEKEREVRGAAKILVSSVRAAMAAISQIFFDSPSQRLRLIGVTGTNGKTTTTYLIEAVMAAQNYKTGLLGTVKYKVGSENLPVMATTPEAPDLQKMLRIMVDSGVSFAVMEVSSHALELNRVSGCDFDTVVLTNVTEDHLDFHQTYERYLAAKGKLFSQPGGSFLKGTTPRFTVLNRDDTNYEYFLRQSTVQSVSYGIKNHAEVQAQNIEVTGDGVKYRVVSPWGEEYFSLRLTGYFNIYNTLAATSVALLEGVPLQAIKEVLESVTGVPGRFERVDMGQDFLVIVDYAHTPDGLDNILQTARGFARGKIITIFGCGGERDRAKRPVMGRIAGKYSDYCILTSDNPRGEDPWQIINEVEAGLQEVKALGSGYTVQPDRYEAIKLGIELARARDIVIIAGKGHENYQIFSDYTIPFSDREVAAGIIEQRLKKRV